MAKKGKQVVENLNRILEVLEEKGVSQYRLHKDSGISYALINAYTKNAKQPGLKQLKLIADTLGVKVRDLINE
jgi:transcriptional regulator with XRE-family HTH domain